MHKNHVEKVRSNVCPSVLSIISPFYRILLSTIRISISVFHGHQYSGRNSICVSLTLIELFSILKLHSDTQWHYSAAASRQNEHKTQRQASPDGQPAKPRKSCQQRRPPAKRTLACWLAAGCTSCLLLICSTAAIEKKERKSV